MSRRADEAFKTGEIQVDVDVDRVILVKTCFGVDTSTHQEDTRDTLDSVRVILEYKVLTNTVRRHEWDEWNE